MSSRSRASIGVSKTPGAIVFTRIAQLARSRAATKVMPWTPALDAEYDVCPICPSNAATEAVSTIAPRSPSSISLPLIRAADSRSTLYVPTRLIFRTCSKVSSAPGVRSLSMIRTRSPPRPAQCTTARSGPASSAASSAALTPASSVMSAGTKRAAFPRSAAACSPGDDGRSRSTTESAPLSTSRRAVASPRPEAPPVTSAEMPSICMPLLLQAERSADDRLHDLAGPAVDAGHPGVGEQPRDRVLEDVAIAAEQLQAPVDHAGLHLGAEQLHLGRVGHRQLAAHVLEHGPVD